MSMAIGVAKRSQKYIDTDSQEKKMKQQLNDTKSEISFTVLFILKKCIYIIGVKNLRSFGNHMHVK